MNSGCSGVSQCDIINQSINDGRLAHLSQTMELWSKVCHQDTLSNVDLVLYKAKREEEGTREY